jgi:hypothetical protein
MTEISWITYYENMREMPLGQHTLENLLPRPFLPKRTCGNWQLLWDTLPQVGQAVDNV